MPRVELDGPIVIRFVEAEYGKNIELETNLSEGDDFARIILREGDGYTSRFMTVEQLRNLQSAISYAICEMEPDV